MIDVNGLRNGTTFELNNNIYKVLNYHHNKTGRGKATIRVKVRDLRSGSIVEMTFNSGERIQDIRLDFHNVQFLYSDGDFYHFMDLETYEQPALRKEVLGDSANYLTENMEVKLTFFNNEPLDIDLPISVNLKVVEAEAAVRGDTATGVTNG